MKQEYTSERTSVRQISAVYNKVDFKEYSTILDIGCGKYYQDTVEEMSKRKCIACGYDPYNQDEVINKLSLSMFYYNNPDYIVCSNVLNVIKEDECVEEVIKLAESYADVDTEIIFSVYERNGSGVGSPTIMGWQRNEKANAYIPKIEKYLDVVNKRGNMIFCRKKAG